MTGAPLQQRQRRAIEARRAAALDRLSPRLRRLYQEQICVQSEFGCCLRRAAWEVDYERKPVYFGEFIEDDFYLGRALGRSMHAKLIADAAEFFDGEWCLAVFAGAIGYGKTTLGQAMLLYDVYRVSCLRTPALAYGMRPGASIVFLSVSVTKKQAEEVFFTGLCGIASQSPYFTEIFPYNPRVKTELQFPKGLRCAAAVPSEQAALGDNILCACLDEANFWQVIDGSRKQTPGQRGNYDQVVAVYNKLNQRLRSRMNLRGRLPGHILVLSSARYPADFTERLECQAREEAKRGEYYTFFRRHSLWDTAPPGKFMSETFRVEVGDFSRRSRVLTGDETDVNQANVIEVPVDLKRDFEHDPDGCVRDFAGISVLAIRPFLARREMVQQMFARGEAAGLKHPFTKYEVTLQEEDPDLERLLPENLHWVDQIQRDEYDRLIVGPDGSVQSKRVLFPALYHAHIDLSKTGDASGLVIAHVVGAVKIKRFNASEMKDVEELKPIIRVDLVLRIVAPPRGEIDIPRIRAILYELNRRYGMQFGKITFDTFGSQEAIKTMKGEGFKAGILTVDGDAGPYEALRTALYDTRILCYPVPVLERELVQLEYRDGKVDHPASHGGSKDLADALAGAVQHCEDSWRAGEASRGLFQLGIVEREGELPERFGQEGAALYSDVMGEPGKEEDADKLVLSGFLGDLFKEGK